MNAVLDLTNPAANEPATPRDTAVMPGFVSQSNWELAQRVGKAYASSTLVPSDFQGNVANCIVALEMANRMGASPLMVMQNLYIVHGRPAWSSKFLIATFNQCGRFSALRYEWTADRTACHAWATEKATGERLVGPQVSIQMARDEGWSTKSGSKWKTMPELMLMYRAAAFFVRTYAPELSMGLRTDDEVIDMGEATPAQSTPSGIAAVRAALAPTGQVDPDTGEIRPTDSGAGSNQARSYAQLADAISTAADRDAAALAIDEGRTSLPAEQYRDLLAHFNRVWNAED